MLYKKLVFENNMSLRIFFEEPPAPYMHAFLMPLLLLQNFTYFLNGSLLSHGSLVYYLEIALMFVDSVILAQGLQASARGLDAALETSSGPRKHFCLQKKLWKFTCILRKSTTFKEVMLNSN